MSLKVSQRLLLAFLGVLNLAGFAPALFSQTLPAPVNFGSVPLGSSSASQTVTFPYSLDHIPSYAGAQHQFTGNGDCSSGACSVPVTFTPYYPGLDQGTVGSLFSDVPADFYAAAVPVHGIGLGPEIAIGPGLIITQVNRPLANADFQSIASFLFDPMVLPNPATFYIANPADNRIEVTPGGWYGSRDKSPGFAGDGGSILDARFNHPSGLARDPLGNMLIADTGNGRIRKLILSGYDNRFTISTIAGNGTVGAGGDGGLAINASLESPTYIAVGSTGDIYVSDTLNSTVRVISAQTGIISRVAGTAGQGGYFGDGGAATVAILNHPLGLALDANDNLYIADAGNNVIRKVSGGVIATVAGMAGVIGSYTGDGGPALSATFNAPSALAVDAGGSLYISDTGNNVIRKVSGDTSHTVTTIVGTGVAGYV